MFDLPIRSRSAQHHTRVGSGNPDNIKDLGLSFALTRPSRKSGAAVSEEGRSDVLARFATLGEAMSGALAYADIAPSGAGPQVLAVLDRDGRLVLAGVAQDGAMAWCQPVANYAEARSVVLEASQTRAQALHAADWKEPDLAKKLRHRADLLEARLVDPLWRGMATRAVQVAA